MKKRPFYIVDVFAEEKYAGNQLAVVRDASDLSDGEMLKIAKEMNYSETTFIMSDEPKNGGFDVRIYTPDIELPFAGHPTLGTAYILRNQILESSRPVLLQVTPVFEEPEFEPRQRVRRPKVERPGIRGVETQREFYLGVGSIEILLNGVLEGGPPRL